MSDKKPVPDINFIRKEIDRVDNALLSLIAERLQLSADVRRAKSGSRIWRPSREDSHVRDLSEGSGGASALLVSRVWAELMSASLAVQGAMRLHIALEGDMLDVWTLVRDRFGAALPALSYPTTSSALAAAYSDEEGVAIVPPPGGMNSWWTALRDTGAMPDMHILAGLPRVSDGHWPRAVAVATADIAPSGADDMLIVVTDPSLIHHPFTALGEAGGATLILLSGYMDSAGDAFAVLKSHDQDAKIIGCLPRALSQPLTQPDVFS